MRLLASATVTLTTLFTLLTPIIADKAYHTDLESYEEGAFGDIPKQRFYSSDVVAPRYQINYWNHEKIDTGRDSRFMFMAGQYGQWGPSIVSSKDLSLVWADQNYEDLAQVARTWDLNGDRVMTSFSNWTVRVYNESYDQIHAFEAQGDLNGTTVDSHEASITPDGHILMIACPSVKMDLRSVGGPKKGHVADCNIQEIEPTTGEVLFQWATSSYFGPKDSYWKYKTEYSIWDWCHMNSAEKTEEGNYLISFRHLACVIMVDGKTGEVMWQMWGKRNMYSDITKGITKSNLSAHFGFQHEARISGKNRFTLFDNHYHSYNGYCTKKFEGECSRGLEVEYDPEEHMVWVVNEWTHPQSLISASRGGVQRTSNGNVAVAWGQNPMYTEYTADGELAMDIQRGRIRHMEHGVVPVITYRIWKGDWIGRPTWGPNISCHFDDVGRSVFVSWNGATEVDQWVMLMSDDAKGLNGADQVVARSPRNGFETQFELQDMEILQYARVAALDVNGTIIGSTPAVNTLTYHLIDLDYEIDEVFAGGSKTFPEAVHSSLSVTVPMGTKIPEGSPRPSPPKMKSPNALKGEKGSGGDTSSMFSPRVVGGALAGVALCAVAIGSLVLFLHRRERSQPSLNNEKPAVTYDVMGDDGDEPYEDRVDSPGPTKYAEESTRSISSTSSR